MWWSIWNCLFDPSRVNYGNYFCCRWTQAASGAAGRANTRLCPAVVQQLTRFRLTQSHSAIAELLVASVQGEWCNGRVCLYGWQRWTVISITTLFTRCMLWVCFVCCTVMPTVWSVFIATWYFALHLAALWKSMIRASSAFTLTTVRRSIPGPTSY